MARPGGAGLSSIYSGGWCRRMAYLGNSVRPCLKMNLLVSQWWCIYLACMKALGSIHTTTPAPIPPNNHSYCYYLRVCVPNLKGQVPSLYEHPFLGAACPENVLSLLPRYSLRSARASGITQYLKVVSFSRLRPSRYHPRPDAHLFLSLHTNPETYSLKNFLETARKGHA